MRLCHQGSTITFLGRQERSVLLIRQQFTAAPSTRTPLCFWTQWSLGPISATRILICTLWCGILNELFSSFDGRRMAQTVSWTTVVGDTLSAHTNGCVESKFILRLYFSVDHEAITSDTMDHIRNVQRSHPLNSSTWDRLASSRTFSLELLDDLSPGRLNRHAKVYRCRIAAIDGEASTSLLETNICVKLFDDRLSKIYPPEEPDEMSIGNEDAMWWTSHGTDEDSVRNEDTAYRQLSFVQEAWSLSITVHIR